MVLGQTLRHGLGHIWPHLNMGISLYSRQRWVCLLVYVCMYIYVYVYKIMINNPIKVGKGTINVVNINKV